MGRRYLAHTGGRGGTDAAGPRGSHEVGWTASGGHRSRGEAAASKRCRAGAGCRQPREQAALARKKEARRRRDKEEREGRKNKKKRKSLFFVFYFHITSNLNSCIHKIQ